MFGADAVTCAAPYLGCTVCSPHGDGPYLRPALWSADAGRATRAGTWAGPCKKVTERAEAIAAARQSPAARAE
eukprot:8783353-Alexandrium_andersonii.AAC.1